MPGLDGTGRLFAPLLAEFGTSMPVTAVTYPVDQVLRYSDLVPIVEQMLPEGDFALVAESFSGPLAVEVAVRNAKRLRGLVLVASFLRSPIRSSSLLRLLLGPLFALRPPTFVIRRLLSGNDAPKALLDEFKSAVRQVGADVLRARVREVLDVDVTTLAEQLTVPVLYLAGSQDRLVGRESLELVRQHCPQLETAVLDAPHLVLQRRPKEAAAAIRRFLKQ